MNIQSNETLTEVYKTTRRKGFGKEARRRVMLGTYALSAGYYDAYYIRAQKIRTLIIQDFAKAFEKVDVIMAPTTPSLPFSIGEKASDPLSMYLSDVFTVSVNLAGLPAISIPCAIAEREGKQLPVGLQIIGKLYHDNDILEIASWFNRKI